MEQAGGASSSGHYRAKVYTLQTENGEWLDKGTGHIGVEYLEKADAHGLVVVSEDGEGSTLLVHRISKDDIYNRSGEATIINWHDHDVNADLAVSFQEAAGCEHIWQQIKQVQREYKSAEGGGGQFDQQQQPSAQQQQQQQQSQQQYEGPDTGGVELPAAEIGNLEEISKALSATSPFQRERIAAAMLKPGYIPALLDIFRQCEDLEDGASLAHMYVIVKTAIMLNDASLLEEMLREEYVMDIVGALEHDPDFKTPQKHREFLQSCVQFKEVVPISDPALMAKIHQTYRIQYIKDVILPRALDDATYTTLTSLALFNNVEVVTALTSDARFLPELFLRLEKHGPDDAEWKDLIAFLQEFCGLARHLQPNQRQSLFSRLVDLGLFNQATRILTYSPAAVKLRATDILLSITQHDVGCLRDFLLHQKDHTLFTLLVRELTEGGDDTGLPEQTCELLKTLLDPETMDTAIEKNEFVELFYDKYVLKLLQVITLDKAISREGTRHVPASLLGLIVDMFCFFVQHHSYRVKYFVLRAHMIEKVLRVVRRREKWLACAGVRFLRTCIASKDDFYTRSIVKSNTFEPVMTVFFENGDRYNLLNSAVLDIIDFVRKENLRELINHLVDQFGQRFEDIYYVDTFKALKLKYDQMHEPSAAGAEGAAPGAEGPAAAAAGGSQEAGAAGGVLHGRTFAFSATGEPVGAGGLGRKRRGDERGLDKDEEDYFNSEDDGDGDGEASGAGGGGVAAGAAGAGGEEFDAARENRDWRRRGDGPAAGPPGPRQERGEERGAGQRVQGQASGSQAGAAASTAGQATGTGPAGQANGAQAGREGSAAGSGAAAADEGGGGWRLVEYEDEEEEEQGAADGAAAGEAAGRATRDLGRRPAAAAPGEAAEPRKAPKESPEDSPGGHAKTSEGAQK